MRQDRKYELIAIAPKGETVSRGVYRTQAAARDDKRRLEENAKNPRHLHYGFTFKIREID